MKDLIAKLQMDANCALGAIWMHIDAQAARIAELEAQIPAASAPVVKQQPIGYLRQSEIDKLADHRVAGVGMMLYKEPGEGKIAVYAEPQPPDTDKLREALPYADKVVQFLNHLEDVLDDKNFDKIDGKLWAELTAPYQHYGQTALQAPVREVPEPEPDMLWEAAEPEDGVTGNSPKDFAENYASAAVGRGETHDVDVLCATRSHKRTMRVSVSADEDAEDWLHWEWVDALPAAPVQEPKP